MKWLTALLLASLSGCAAPSKEEAQRGPWNLPGSPPHLIAHYMPWFRTPQPDDPASGWSHWNWNGPGPAHDPGKTLESGRRDIASVVYPLIGPYDSRSPAVVRYHLRTAKAAGIAALGVIWYGPGSDTDQVMPLLLDEAQRCGLRVAVCYEEKINFPGYRQPRTRDELVESATADLSYIVTQYGDHPAYLAREGKPFIYQFNYWGTGKLGPNNLRPSEWKRVFAALPRSVCYARQNLDEQHHPTIEGAYVWWTEDESYLRDVARKAADLRRGGHLAFFMTMVCPGFDDTGVFGWGNGPRKSPEYGVSVLQRTFDIATQHDPELIQVVTWNDFNEATVVEPTVEHGHAFLDALETWWGQRFGRPVNLDDNKAPYREYVKTCSEAERALLPASP